MTREELFDSAVGGCASTFAMLVGIIDVKSVFNAILIAFVGTVTGYFTRKILQKWFSKKQ